MAAGMVNRNDGAAKVSVPPCGVNVTIASGRYRGFAGACYKNRLEINYLAMPRCTRGRNPLNTEYSIQTYRPGGAKGNARCALPRTFWS